VAPPHAGTRTLVRRRATYAVPRRQPTQAFSSELAELDADVSAAAGLGAPERALTPRDPPATPAPPAPSGRRSSPPPPPASPAIQDCSASSTETVADRSRSRRRLPLYACSLSLKWSSRASKPATPPTRAFRQASPFRRAASVARHVCFERYGGERCLLFFPWLAPRGSCARWGWGLRAGPRVVRR
jgi:hypothetical protein